MFFNQFLSGRVSEMHIRVLGMPPLETVEENGDAIDPNLLYSRILKLSASKVGEIYLKMT